MQLERATAIVAKFAEGLPKEIVAQLGDVEIIVCQDPATAYAELSELITTEDGEPLDQIEATQKGVFVGEPMEIEDNDGEGEHVIETLPNGVIAVIASNIENDEEVVTVFLHEIGHALGLDEEGVAELGLGVSPAKTEAPANVPSPNDVK